LEEFERVRGDKKRSEEEPFVFAAPKGFPFPRDAEQRFLDRKAHFEEKHGPCVASDVN
jgi:hypothetical protein